jgi:hypothetical protein
MELESAREEYKQQQSFGPDEVVEYLIESKMMQNQEKFLLYLKLEDLITKQQQFLQRVQECPGKPPDRDPKRISRTSSGTTILKQIWAEVKCSKTPQQL